jgi:hypothetical protein
VLGACTGNVDASCDDRRQVIGPSRPRPARARVAEPPIPNSVRAVGLPHFVPSLFRRASCGTVQYSTPQQCFKPLIAQRSLSIGASDKSVYSPLGISPLAPLSCLLGVPAMGENKNIVSGYSIWVDRNFDTCCKSNEACRTASHVSFSGCIGSFPFRSRSYFPNYHHYRPSAGSSLADVRLKGYSATREDSPHHMQSAYMN